MIKFRKLLVLLLIPVFVVINLTQAEVQETTAQPSTDNANTEKSHTEQTTSEKRFTINAENGSIKKVLTMLAKQAGLKIYVSDEVGGNVSYQLNNVTLKEALDAISKKRDIEYSISNDTIYVGARPTDIANNQGVKLIKLRFVNATEVQGKIATLLSNDDKVIVDELNNAIIFNGSPTSYSKVMSFIRLLDRMPTQVLIEARIIEASKTFSRNFGVDWTYTKGTRGVSTLTGGASTGNIAIKSMVGNIGSTALDVSLAAAERTGDARVVSKPKIVTLNNKTATINSGLTYYVKTLSSTTTGTGSTTESISGGLEKVSAGLTVSVLPIIIDEKIVKLNVDINNSQPDNSQLVDGIPGVSNNAASTSIMVNDGDTAVIAGLIKKTNSNSDSGVPFIKDIPILGFFFKGEAIDDRKDELMIFITPSVIKGVLKNESKTALLEKNEIPAK